PPMKIRSFVFALAGFSSLAVAASAQTASTASSPPSLDGDWTITTQSQFGPPQYAPWHFTVDGGKLTASSGNQRIEGTFHDGALKGVLTAQNRPATKITGTLRDGELAGEGQAGENTFTWNGRRPAVPPASGPRTHQFVPTQFHN